MQNDSIGFPKSLPEYALQGKLQDPLVAVLGGIILVSTSQSVVTNAGIPGWEILPTGFRICPTRRPSTAIDAFRRGKATPQAIG